MPGHHPEVISLLPDVEAMSGRSVMRSAGMETLVRQLLGRGMFLRPVAIRCLTNGVWTSSSSCIGVRCGGFLSGLLMCAPSSGIQRRSLCSASAPLVTIMDEPDTLYKKIAVMVKGHDRAVLDSYEYFATFAAKELGISIEKVYEPPRKIERLTLLKSVHIYNKHRVQYEMRTHYRCIELKHLTGSTADIYLEYIQRNLPEGVAMEIKKTTLERLPEHIQEPVWDPTSQEAASTRH
ncbi:small ribosomal subunit protein uS10m isoform X2 [Latimeria chalumnae]|nr:PREDICTED: 28S ribosomal protein S10, mitochondrial isoform X2 [Latimeria chalumnae]|eukprot:XP_014344712.1 PREDICTED: 28S ribosomal protein S10, mitochondrial isoform X2 [Latimeria chalumnae]